MAIVGFLLGGSLCQSSEIVVAEWAPSQVSGQTANSSIYWGQIFTAAYGGTLRTISINAYNHGATYPLPPVCYFDVYTVNNGMVITPPIASVGADTSAMPVGSAWLTATFDVSAVPLRAGRQYAFSMRFDTANNQYMSFPGQPGYAGGGMIASDNQGRSFYLHSSLMDLKFRVTAESIPVEVYPALELAFPTEIGARYQLQFVTDLVGGSWVNLGNPVIGLADSTSFFDSTRQAQKRFYRILQVP